MMAVLVNKLSTWLQLKVKEGVDQNGGDIISTQTFRRVKTDASDDSIYEVAQAIGSLESTPVVSTQKTDSYELTNQA